MRNVKIGRFADYKPAEFDYGSGLIGARIATRYEQEKLVKTIGLEYYITDKYGKNIMLNDASIIEKILAKTKYLFKRNKRKVVGYRTNKISDLLQNGYQLGMKLNEKGNWVVDQQYLDSRKKVNRDEIKEASNTTEDIMR